MIYRIKLFADELLDAVRKRNVSGEDRNAFLQGSLCGGVERGLERLVRRFAGRGSEASGRAAATSLGPVAGDAAAFLW